MISLGTTGLLTLTTRPLEARGGRPALRRRGEKGAVLWAANVLACGQVRPGSGRSWGRACVCRQSVFGETAGLPRVGPRPRQRSRPEATAWSPCRILWAGAPQRPIRRHGAFVGLTPSHTAADFYRSLLESVGYALRRGFVPIQPTRVRRAIATAGGAASSLGARPWPIFWRRPSSTILPRPARWGSHSSPVMPQGASTASRRSGTRGWRSRQ